MNKLIRFMIHKVTIISLLILVQLIFFGYIVFSMSKISNTILYVLEAISYLIVIYVLTGNEPLQYKNCMDYTDFNRTDFWWFILCLIQTPQSIA